MGDLFDFSNLDENHVFFSNKYEKTIGTVKLETPKKSWLDAFVCSRSKALSFICNVEISNKIKGSSKPFPCYSKN